MGIRTPARKDFNHYFRRANSSRQRDMSRAESIFRRRWSSGTTEAVIEPPILHAPASVKAPIDEVHERSLLPLGEIDFIFFLDKTYWSSKIPVPNLTEGFCGC